MKKNKFLLLLAMSVLCVLCAFAGCKGCKKANKNDELQSKLEREDNTITLELNKTVFSNMVIGDELLLYATFTEISGESVQWESSNTQVATVERVDKNIAKVVAFNVGEAVITAKYGSFVQSCSVSVTQNGIYPALYLQNGVKENAVIEKGAQFDLSTYVLFNGKQFDDMQVDYILEDPSYGVIDKEQKTFTAGDKTGPTSITIVASWRNIPSELLKQTITLKIISSTVVSVNNGEFSQIDLYTVASWQGTAYKNQQTIHSVKVEEDGQAITDYTITITNHQAADGTDREVAVWDGEKVIANAYGKANFTVSVGNDYSISYPINVKRPLARYTEQIEWFSYLDGELPVDDIFSQSEGKIEIIDAYQEGRALNVQDGKVFGVSSKAMDEMSVETVEVYNDKVGYILDLETYAQVIDEPKDMNFMFDGTLNGYVYLKNNVVVQESLASIGAQAIFSGVFEGNGYKITVPMRRRGIFGGTLKGTVRNVWFEITNVKNLVANDYGQNVLLAGNATEFATLENIYVTLDSASATAPTLSIALFGSVGKNTTIKNLVADFGDILPSSGYTANYYGLLCQTFGSIADECEYENVYFISSGLKYLSHTTKADEPTKGSITYAANDGALREKDSAEDSIEKDRNQYVVASAKRYDTLADLIADNNDLTTFDTRYWEVKGGYPAWRTIKATANGVETNKISLFNSANTQENAATIDVQVMGKSVPFTLSVQSGDASILSIVGNKVTAKQGVTGSVTLAATYQDGNDQFTMTFYVNVLPALSNKVMYWSTGSQQAYVPDGLLQAGETLESVTDFETSTRLYSAWGGYNNEILDNTANEIKTFRALIRGSKGTLATLMIRSYACVITKASDMQFLAAAGSTITGHYIMLNDVTVNAWDDDSATTMSAINFNGVFDGNGYTLSTPQRLYGLFGTVGENAIVKNVRMNVTARGSKINDIVISPVTNQTGGLLAYEVYGTFENMYVQVSGTAATQGIGLVGRLKPSSSLKNVVVDYGTVYKTGITSGQFYKGYLTVAGYRPEAGATLQNVYAIGDNNGSTLLHERGSSVGLSYNAYAENEVPDRVLDEKYDLVVDGVRRYDELKDIEDDANANLTGFDATYWDTTSGAPVWRNK